MLTLLILFLYLSLGTCSNYSFIAEYAPRIYMDKNESYFPSSVNYFTKYTHLENINGSNWIISDQKLPQPSAILPYFHGMNVSLFPLVYAVIMPGINEKDPVVALKDPYNHTIMATYFTFYPYNRGKQLFGVVWDNHVGDIEHVHVKFVNGLPTEVIASYHAWNTIKKWGDRGIEMVNGTNHFILYSARGSHGLWFSSGTHQYHTNPRLCDYTSKGQAWDTWMNLTFITPYEWNSYRAYNTTWLTNVLRWGDPHTEFPDNCFFGFCRLNDGPVGMLGKSQIEETIRSLKKRGYICSNGCLWNSGIF